VVAGEGANGQQGQGREDDQADTQPGGLSDACHGQRSEYLADGRDGEDLAY